MEIRGDRIIGMDTPDGEGYFSYNGCDNCANGLGNIVFDCIAYTEKWRAGEDDLAYYEVRLCPECIYAYHNGEPVDENCKDVFKL